MKFQNILLKSFRSNNPTKQDLQLHLSTVTGIPWIQGLLSITPELRVV